MNLVKAYCHHCEKEVEEKFYLWAHRTTNSPDRKYFCTTEEERAYRKLHPLAKVYVPDPVKPPKEKPKPVAHPAPCAICLEVVTKDPLYETRTGLRVFGCSHECIGQIKQRARRAQLGME